jgi:hypothetical protein
MARRSFSMRAKTGQASTGSRTIAVIGRTTQALGPDVLGGPDHAAHLEVMGRSHADPSIGVMGRPDHGTRVDVMGRHLPAPGTDVMGGPDRGVRLDVMGRSDRGVLASDLRAHEISAGETVKATSTRPDATPRLSRRAA